MARKRALFALIAASARLSRLTRRRRDRSEPATAVLAPSDPGNVGDRAMLCAVFGNTGGRGVLLSVAERISDAEAGLGSAATVNVRDLFQRPALPAFAAAWRLGRVLGEADTFLVVGADVMDGGYSAWRSEVRFGLATVAARCDLRSAIVNMSWNATPHPRAVAAMRRAHGVQLVAREAVSARRLRELGAHDVAQSADIAFLSEEFADPGRAPGEWLAQQRSQARAVVVVNLNPLVAPAERLVELVKPACERLLDSGSSLLLIAHDRRDASDRDSGAHEALLDALVRDDPPARERLATWQATGPGEVREVMRSVSFVISCRMHLIILAATVGVPAIGFEYQGKMTGLFEEHFGAPHLIVDVAAAGPDDLVKLVEQLASGCDAAADDLRSRLPEIRERALRNLPA